jgi:hypothetical protein
MESEEFAQFLRDPTVPLKQKSTVLQEVLSSVKVNDLTKNFFSAYPPPRSTSGRAPRMPAALAPLRVRPRQWCWRRTTASTCLTKLWTHLAS